MDFARANTASIELLSAWIVQTLRSISQKYDVVVHNNDPVLLFGELIEALYNKEQAGVVVLVDEYDKPIMEHLENESDSEKFRDFMESFYKSLTGENPFALAEGMKPALLPVSAVEAAACY